MRQHQNPNPAILLLSVPLTALIIFSSWKGLFGDDFYALETLNWQSQSIGQDVVDLFLIVPVLMITSYLAYRNNKISLLLWGGTLLYLLYTFTIFCFNIHFNSLFIVYCLILSLSAYSFLYFIYLQSKDAFVKTFSKNIMIRVIALYFIVISSLFYFLWLSEIIPAILNSKTPGGLAEVGLLTNPVHVLDLSIFLPGVFIVGILLLRENPIGYVLTPVVLTFFVLMDLTIASLILVMNQKGIQVNLMIALVMVLLSMLSLLLLVKYVDTTRNEEIEVTNNAVMQNVS